ncbi:hypothetical protein V9T40_007720 [Parthenolecanium corni]|uniref:Uncharacterized protein n=1 Tax=Parthenolecanium corni TaxID=536013 RepID=A0AAN9TKD9_9HEMI
MPLPGAVLLLNALHNLRLPVSTISFSDRCSASQNNSFPSGGSGGKTTACILKRPAVDLQTLSTADVRRTAAPPSGETVTGSEIRPRGSERNAVTEGIESWKYFESAGRKRTKDRRLISSSGRAFHTDIPREPISAFPASDRLRICPVRLRLLRSSQNLLCLIIKDVATGTVWPIV